MHPTVIADLARIVDRPRVVAQLIEDQRRRRPIAVLARERSDVGRRATAAQAWVACRAEHLGMAVAIGINHHRNTQSPTQSIVVRTGFDRAGATIVDRDAVCAIDDDLGRAVEIQVVHLH